LKGEREEEIKLITFGSEMPKLIKTFSTNISVRLNNGEYISIVANIVPIISGSIQRRKMDEPESKRTLDTCPIFLCGFLISVLAVSIRTISPDDINAFSHL
jgi:hypothetical protein